MMFVQERQYSKQEIAYTLSYDFSESDGGLGKTVLNVQLEIEAGNNWNPPIDYFLDTSDALHTSIATFTHSEETLQLSLKLYITMTESSQKLILIVGDTETTYTPLHFPIPAPPVLRIFYRIVNGENTKDIVDKLEDIYEDRLIYDSLDDASACLSTEHYFMVKNSLANNSDEFKSFINNNRHSSFRNLMAGTSKGVYHQVSSVTELRTTIQNYNEYLGLEDVEFEQVIEAILDDIYKETYVQDYQPVIFDPVFHEACSNISEYHFDSLLSLLIDIRNLSAAKSLTRSWIPSPDYDDYEEKKEMVLNEDFKRYSDKAIGFRELLFDAISDDHEFKFIAANYLFWTARRYNENHEHLAIQPQLFRSANILAEEIGIYELAKRADYQYNITKGHQLRLDDPHTATDRYRDALSIGQEIDQYTYFVPPFRYLAETQANIHNEEREYEEGVERLDNKIRLLESVEDVSTHQRDYAIKILRAWYHNLKAHFILQSQDVATAIEPAKAELENAIRLFDESNKDDLREGAIGRRIELEALNARFMGDFKKEGGYHEQYINKFSDKRATPYHTSQKWICRAKAALLEQNYETAREYINQLEEELGFIHDQDRPIKLILEVALDYSYGNQTDPTPIFRELYNIGEDNHLLYFQSDYSTAIAQILAAQRFLQWPIDTKLLDALVDCSLRHAFTPSTEGRLDDVWQSEFPLKDLSIDQLWREKLPLNVLEKLQNAELNAETNPDWDSTVEIWMRALERQLALVVEYHGKQFWGSTWKHDLTGIEVTKPTEEIKLSLGHFFEFFRRDAGQQLSCAESVIDQYEATIIRDVSIKRIRDTLAHGDELQITEPEEEYQQIRDAILTLMRTLSGVTPNPGYVWEQLPNSVYINFLYNSSNDRVIVVSDKDFITDTIYYFPPDQIGDKLIVEVESKEIVRCEDPRGLKAHFDD